MNVKSTNWALIPPSNNSTDSFLTTSFNTLSITSDTESTSRTIPGPGALSGKAILALGKATLRGAEVIIIRRRFQVISSKFPHKDEDNIKGIDRMYEDILELSRRDLYSEGIRTRALNIILAQIGSGHVEKLVQCLASWHDVECLILLSELIEMFDPLRLAGAPKTGDLSSSIRAYQSSFADIRRHGLEPFVFFLCQLILASENATRVVFDAGIMRFLVHAYTSGFSDPLAAKAEVVDPCSHLRMACDSFLDTVSKSKKGPILFSKDQFHVLWPTQPGSLLFRKIPDRRARRVEIWRSANAEIVALRMQSILNMMLLEDHRGLLDQDSLGDIASDILELSRDGIHREAVTNWVLKMSLILIGSRRTKELVYCVSTWPVADIQVFVSKLTYMFNPLRLSVAKVEGNFSNLIQIYHQSSVGTEVDHSLEPVVNFIHHLAQVSDCVSEAVLGGGTLEFFTHIYIANFFDPLGDDMFRGSPALRAACDSTLRTCSGTQTGLVLISSHQLSTLWPTSVLPASPSAHLAIDRSVQRAKIWKEMEEEFVLLRVQSIFNLMVMGDRWGPLELDSLENIAADMLDFSRGSDYQNPFKARVADMMLLLVGSGGTEEFIYCLATWPFAEMKAFIIELTEKFDPLWGMQVSIGLSKIRGYSLNAERSCSLESIVIFLERLAQHCESASRAILEGGVLDFLLHLYFADFCDPLATDMDHRRLNLQVACDSLLRILSKTERGLFLIDEHDICILWPSAPTLQLIKTMPDRPARRAEAWRSIDPEHILLRLALILNRVMALTLNRVWGRTEQERCLDHPEICPLNDLIVDVLEFVGHNHRYPDRIKDRALGIILVLIGSGRAEGLVHGLDTWSPSHIGLFVTELVETFVSREFRTLQEREGRFVSSLVQAYYRSLTGSEAHLMEPLFTFCSRVVQKRPAVQEGPYWSANIGFLLYSHLPDFRHTLPAKSAGVGNQATLQQLYDSISTASSRSKVVKRRRQTDVPHPYDAVGGVPYARRQI